MTTSVAPTVGGIDALARDGGGRSENDSSGRGGGDDDGGGDDHGGEDGGDRDGDDDDGGDDRGGDDDGGGNDDDDGDDRGRDDGDDDSRARSGGKSRRSDQERARAAVEQGQILPLRSVLRLVDERRYGTVIAVDLKRYGGRDVYRLKTRDNAGTIRNYRIDARTGKLINFFGF